MLSSPYIIKQGDTLGQLAQTYGTDVSTLQRLNPSITDPNKIYAGNSLILPSSYPPASQNPAPTITPTPTPAPSPQPTNPIPTRQPRPEENILKQLQDQLTQESSTAEETKKQQKEVLTNQLNARLAEIDRLTNERVRAEQEQGQRELARARGINIRAGLIGSDFGEARKTGVEERTKKAVGEVQALGAEKKAGATAEVNASLQNIEDRHNERLTGIRKERGGLLMKGLEFQQKAQEDALNDWKTLAKSGRLSFESAKANGMLEEIKNQTGKTDQQLELEYASNLPKSELLEKLSFRAGNKYYMFYKDPASDSPRKVEIDLGNMPPQYDTVTFDKNNGEMLWYSKDASIPVLRKKITGGKGGSGLTPYQQFNAGMNIGNKVDKLNQGAKDTLNRVALINTAYERYDKGETKDLNATTQVIINNFNKVLDPSSVVRESEYARSPQGQAFLSNLEGRLNKLAQGGAGLTKQSLKEFVDLSNEFAKNAKASIEVEKKRAIDYAQKFGIDTSYVGGGYVQPYENSESSYEVEYPVGSGNIYTVDVNGDMTPK